MDKESKRDFYDKKKFQDSKHNNREDPSDYSQYVEPIKEMSPKNLADFIEERYEKLI